MKAITLWQPWATLVASSLKTVETRSWGTPYRGPIAIHAARKADGEILGFISKARDDLKKCWGLQFLRPECKEALSIQPAKTLGCIVAVCLLVDCRPMETAPDGQEELFGNFGPGRWGWLLDGLTPILEPVPCRGMQGLWTVPEDVAARLPAPSAFRCHKLKAKPPESDLFGEDQ